MSSGLWIVILFLLLVIIVLLLIYWPRVANRTFLKRMVFPVTKEKDPERQVPTDGAGEAVPTEPRPRVESARAAPPPPPPQPQETSTIVIPPIPTGAILQRPVVNLSDDPYLPPIAAHSLPQRDWWTEYIYLVSTKNITRNLPVMGKLNEVIRHFDVMIQPALYDIPTKMDRATPPNFSGLGQRLGPLFEHLWNAVSFNDSVRLVAVREALQRVGPPTAYTEMNVQPPPAPYTNVSGQRMEYRLVPV